MRVFGRAQYCYSCDGIYSFPRIGYVIFAYIAVIDDQVSRETICIDLFFYNPRAVIICGCTSNITIRR